MTSYDLTKAINKISGGDTSGLEAIIPPNICLASEKKCCKPPWLLHQDWCSFMIGELFNVVCLATRLPEGITL